MGKFDHWYPGMHLHNWILIQRVPDNPKLSPIMRGRWVVECRCKDKTRKTLPIWYLTRTTGPTRSCGCLNRSLRTEFKREYGIWQMMRRRCNNDTHIHFKHYGGRGIKVCAEWDDDKTGFEAFFAHMGPAPSDKHSIDRINNDLGYQPFQEDGITPQMRWATAKEQRANQRNSTK